MSAEAGDTDPLVRWRRVQLLQAGVPRSLATRVARDERYDLHELLELLQHGCTPALAARMLEPVERDDAA
jgi:hypothetical protein